MKQLPDCITCAWCAWWEKRKNNKRIIELECMKNPNLGAVSIFYQGKCKDYKYTEYTDDTNLYDDNAARQDPEARNKGIHQDARRAQMDYCEGNGGTRL